jgi:hypothetical protein
MSLSLAPHSRTSTFFDCACYPNIAVTAPHKLVPRSTRCVFLGYSTNHKGYRCLDLSTNRLIVSRHVVFDEDSFPLAASPNLTDLDFYVSRVPQFPLLGTPSLLQALPPRRLVRPPPIQRLAVRPPGGPLPRLLLHPAWVHHRTPGRRRRSPTPVVHDNLRYHLPRLHLAARPRPYPDTAGEPSPDGHTGQRRFPATS